VLAERSSKSFPQHRVLGIKSLTTLFTVAEVGIWKLKCAACEQVFEIEILERQNLTEAAKDSKCPTCLHIPSTALTDSQKKHLIHQIIGFRASLKAH
jgi:hypothetical protein